MNELMIPDWSLPASVKACSTTRYGGYSTAPWQTFNLAMHVGDDEAKVRANRQHLRQKAGLPCEPHWLDQVHGTHVMNLASPVNVPCEADASWTNQPGLVCAVMTADCLPVLFCSKNGQEIAAAHAGWRGLCHGILENTLRQFSVPIEDIMAWFGPAIGPHAFEVGEEVRSAFMAVDPNAALAFKPVGNKYFADLALLATQRLNRLGLTDISYSGACTYQLPHYFSWRRDGETGRMASMIWRVS